MTDTATPDTGPSPDVYDELPDAPCLIHGDDRRTWAQVDRRADGVAQWLLDAGLERQQAVAQYLYNCNEYMESMYAAFKGAFAPVNTNYRYTADELLYLWDNADAGAVVFHGSFADTIEAIRDQLPKVKVWLWVDDDGGTCPEWATPYEEAATSGAGRVAPDWGRSGDDLDFLYTGGTTGMPKGVMWRQDDLFGVLDANNKKRLPPEQDLDAVLALSPTHLSCYSLIFEPNTPLTQKMKMGRISPVGEELEKEMKDTPNLINEELLNRIQGALIGLAIGDMMGAPLEFHPHDYLVAHPVKDLQEGGTWGLKKGQVF